QMERHGTPQLQGQALHPPAVEPLDTDGVETTPDAQEDRLAALVVELLHVRQGARRTSMRRTAPEPRRNRWRPIPHWPRAPDSTQPSAARLRSSRWIVL